MLIHRVIPCLLVSQSRGGLVKTLKFGKPKYVGDPINAVKIFNEKEVDELMVLDIDATRERRGPDFKMIEELASECFMPLCYGGGIRTAEDARTLFSLGVEKVALQSVVATNPGIIREIADRAGEQAVVVSIDVKRNWLGRPQPYSAAGVKQPSSDWRDAVRQAVANGAGEILLNAVDRDGTLAGPDLELIREASALAEVPLVAIGGIGSLDDMKAATDAGASAVAAGAYFVFQGPHRAVLITYPRYEELQALWSKNA
ncbi:cyclase [Sphingomonas kyeonggiensis]|uniref:AglZ/HisF2 family acetamidino modification protein n=1 Tax=Sphingomonas kyeonggiensis TaxID=1268553 RepID=UPI002788C10D|nr:AglZ/HisF2 family acetamidino modification protein [Sphingomonas kyeonggiensis]MDQ0250186.1 cyclase [Sphingomonas kyeonggiensis]